LEGADDKAAVRNASAIRCHSTKAIFLKEQSHIACENSRNESDGAIFASEGKIVPST